MNLTSCLRAVATLAFASLTGCATSPALDSLEDPKSPSEPISIQTDTCYEFAGAFGKTAQTCIMDGTYRLHKQNALGKFYLGDSLSVYWKTGDDYVLVRGGIWLPNNVATSPRVFFYLTSDPPIARTVGELRQLRDAAAPGTPKSESTDAITPLAIRNTPSTLSPAKAGVAAGLASVVLSAMAEGGDAIPRIYPEPSTPEFALKIRKSLTSGQLKAP
jgi:hypothetical protein